MSQIVLSDDLIEITAEINTWKQQAGQAVFEIGRRLKHVKEKDLAHGQWEAWLKSVDIEPRTAQRMIQAYDQFGNTTTSSHLPTGKIFEMLSLPESVDRSEFIEKEHVIPSTGESKKVDDMTVRELREVKKSLQEAESKARHFETLFNQTKNQPPKIITKTVEKLPDDYEQTLQANQRLNNENVQLQRTNQELANQLSESKSTTQSLRKLREYCSESIRTISASNTSLLFELNTLEGNPEAYSIADEYGNQLHEITSKFFKELKEIMEVQKLS